MQSALISRHLISKCYNFSRSSNPHIPPYIINVAWQTLHAVTSIGFTLSRVFFHFGLRPPSALLTLALPVHMTPVNRFSHFLCRISHFLCRISHFLCRISHFLCRISHFLCRISHFLCRISHFLCRISHFSMSYVTFFHFPKVVAVFIPQTPL